LNFKLLKMHKRIIATDCGSTTTKAILIEKREDGYRLVARGEAPTTVEKPFEDVTIGVRNAISEIEELTNNKFLENGKIVNVDAYVSTSSAGGGLQMLVMGVVKEMTAESAARAALGAGAIVMETIAINDNRLPHQRIELIRKLRPDMILLAGGTEGGTIKHVVELAELIAAAEPKPRFGSSYKMPLIYAGNSQAVKEIEKILKEKTALYVVDNIRPQLEIENLEPSREKIHELFLEHVMQQAPGYNKLMELVSAPIMPTPGAVGLLIEKVAREQNIEVLGVDIGGATTDVFSVFKGKFNRTVSANLGMSYSIANVMVEAGIENIKRWIPFEIDEYELRNRIRNKMIRPTTIPMTLDDLIIEQAIAREALRLALEQHKLFATELKGIQVRGDITRALQQQIERTLVNMMTLNLVIGSGGVLSHAPRRSQSFLMMIDAFQVEGITKLAVDSIFMMPHLGVLSTINEKAAFEVFERDCLIKLGTCIAPKGIEKDGKVILKAEIHYGNKTESLELKFGELKVFPLPVNMKAKVVLIPQSGFDVGEGPNKKVIQEVEGGVVGLVFDGRGRPLKISREKLIEWFISINAYNEEKLRELVK
jgi:uncharacterized protein (TIGR01319 family)